MKSEGLIFQEQNNLMNWLKVQLHNPPTREDSDYLSLKSTIIDYLKIDPHSEYSQQIKWETVNCLPKRPNRCVSLHQAITTQAAIKILEAYLKSTNPLKWHDLFGKKRPFLNLFKYLRSVDQHATFSKFENKISYWALSGFFPWKGPLDTDYQRKLNFLFQSMAKDNGYVKHKYFGDYNKAEKEIN
ncbi:hypothetical protein VP01_1974g8 [Puccinia sorghi]|uniref:Uncharacterized protein n=1 Tax=Puccinia sorghi TaxID=27349 RepID=A0A0L6VBU4_9BASI|nr:hypothetical protein VP01_1974g8 [Puccinia sorghi]